MAVATAKTQARSESILPNGLLGQQKSCWNLEANTFQLQVVCRKGLKINSPILKMLGGQSTSSTKMATLYPLGGHQLPVSPWRKGIFTPLSQVKSCPPQWVFLTLLWLFSRYRLEKSCFGMPSKSEALDLAVEASASPTPSQPQSSPPPPSSVLSPSPPTPNTLTTD